MSQNESAVPLADDLLKGAAKIGAYIGEDERAAYHLLETGQIPGARLGKFWISSKAQLRRHYSKLLQQRTSSASP